MNDAASTGAKTVVCTCSTIGAVAEAANETSEYVAARIDRAMADEAVSTAQRILVVAAVESTLTPTRELIESSAERLGKSPSIEMLHIKGVWQHFETGDISLYNQAIADHLSQNWSGYDVIVLAQASMAGAADLCPGVAIPILSSPRLGVIAATQAR